MRDLFLIGEPGVPRMIRLEKKLNFYKINYTFMNINLKQNIIKNIEGYPLIVIKDGDEEIKRWVRVVPLIDEIREFLCK